jgi:hypothetical protein
MMLKLLNWLTLPRLLTMIIFIAIFTMAVRLPADSDTWWHLRSGQYIVENQAIYAADPFSHTHQGQVWMYPKLGQILWYGLFALGGWPAVSLGLAVLVTGAFGLIWLVTPGNQYIRAFAVILGVITSSLIWVARPQMISFLLAALVLLLLERHKRSGSRWIYGLPLITLLWASIHGGYAIALMLVAAYIVGESVNHLTKHTDDPVLSWSQIRNLMVIGIISFLAVALNPHGWEMWLYPFRTVGIGALRDYIQEWRSPNFHMSITWPFVMMFLLTVGAMGRAARRVDWTDLAMVGLWVAWSLFAVRNIGLYGLLTVPVLARYADATVGDYLPGKGASRINRRPALVRLNWVLLGLLTLAALLRVGLTLAPQTEAAIEQENSPAGAVQFIAQQRPAGPIFNSYNWGGYILFKLWPEYPVYIDGRTDLYEDEFIRRYWGVMNASQDWQQTLDEDNINLVLIENNSTLAKFLAREPVWTELYRDEMAVIFARNKALAD